MTVLVVADTVKHAKAIAKNMADVGAVPVSPRSIKSGAGRGIATVTDILVDDSVWPLGDDVLALLAPHHALIHRRRSTPRLSAEPADVS